MSKSRKGQTSQYSTQITRRDALAAAALPLLYAMTGKAQTMQNSPVLTQPR